MKILTIEITAVYTKPDLSFEQPNVAVKKMHFHHILQAWKYRLNTCNTNAHGPTQYMHSSVCKEFLLLPSV